MFNNFKIIDLEKGLLFEDGQLVNILEPGQHDLFSWSKKQIVEVVSVLNSLEGKNKDIIFNSKPDWINKYFYCITVSESELALVTIDGVMKFILGPGEKKLYWKDIGQVRAEHYPLTGNIKIPESIASSLAVKFAGSRYISNFVVNEYEVGMLYMEGIFKEVLAPGRHAYWTYYTPVSVKTLSTRQQLIEVGGQELITKDRVTIRANINANWQITDPIKATSIYESINSIVYKEIQFAIRQLIGSRTLDQILDEKELLEIELNKMISPNIAQNGILINEIGIKDIILPGEIRQLMNKVVEAERQAMANVIKRREETAATRSLLNTAKLMEDNPTLLRLKELESLEKIVEKIEQLNVYGGLDGVMNNLVKITK
jgi:regulator of protease activity HflC (stomatin/prohibitin superfamily)